MQKAYLHKLILSLFFASTVFANNKVINNYLRYHKQYFEKTCAKNTDHIAEKLYKSFLGDGLYIPFFDDGRLDVETIKENLPLFPKKHLWIIQTLNRLKKEKSFRPYLRKLRKLDKKFKDILTLRHRYYREKSFPKKKKLVALSKSQVKKFVGEVHAFLNELYFLHTFRFPVDHLYLRTEYDKYKALDTLEGKRKSNSAYFLRKVVEEGAVDKKRGRSDLALRALIDNVYLNTVEYDDSFLSEDLRYDIESLFKYLDSTFRSGKGRVEKRLANWKRRTKRSYLYYQNLINSDKSKVELLKKIYSDKNKARYALRNYIYNKEAQVYKFWASKNELYRKLFALETILFHEVGRLDDNYGSERRDVIRVVLNRVNNSEYNFLAESDPLFQKIKWSAKKTQSYPWLNTLFKQGQFSFTYFFIPASRGIFCPDQSRTAKTLRQKNLKIALEVLRERKGKFNATRYFSRASMLGRIDMSKLWADYQADAQSPGPRIKRDASMRQRYKRGKYTYLYTFSSEDGTAYDVLNYGDKIYVYSKKFNKFYNYRNPHLFRYFSKIESYK